jgi:hypothetical protein
MNSFAGRHTQRVTSSAKIRCTMRWFW